jgi:hypothetical protein
MYDCAAIGKYELNPIPINDEVIIMILKLES